MAGSVDKHEKDTQHVERSERMHEAREHAHERAEEARERAHERVEEMRESAHEAREHVHEKAHEVREQAHEKAHEQVTVFGHPMERSDIFKFAGLIAFGILMAVVVWLMAPLIGDVFNEGGVDRLVERLQSAGPAGVFILLGMQFLQVVVAFIPGEVVQLAAGLMYGPILGALIILFGCLFSSAVIYQLVHMLGAPFVQGMVSTEHLEKFRTFETSGKLDAVVFILFLIPGLPKDVFTYVVPLTDMDIKRFLTLTTIGRIPGVVASTYVASAMARGDITSSVIVSVIVVAVAICAFVFREKIMDMGFLHRDREKGASDE